LVFRLESILFLLSKSKDQSLRAMTPVLTLAEPQRTPNPWGAGIKWACPIGHREDFCMFAGLVREGERDGLLKDQERPLTTLSINHTVMHIDKCLVLLNLCGRSKAVGIKKMLCVHASSMWRSM
jgi:hypothetical protein